ncbi:type VII toxin-antitoxin system HepT family RNase toxin [Marinoscillum sp.]|uniref:type VII toxin-antitoxin system HepT family RNase toxin n=1 Tax=Marinoscillum sp. TaxID=2024838 RepID=UPI003BAA9360
MDDVVQAKVATIEKCLKRIKEEALHDWKTDFTHQDALILNLERACQASIDCASHIVRKKQLGLPKITREVFELLGNAGIIDQKLSEEMKKMVGFRNLAVHDYAALNLDILEAILTNKLPVFSSFCKTVINIAL